MRGTCMVHVVHVYIADYWGHNLPVLPLPEEEPASRCGYSILGAQASTDMLYIRSVLSTLIVLSVPRSCTPGCRLQNDLWRTYLRRPNSPSFMWKSQMCSSVVASTVA